MVVVVACACTPVVPETLLTAAASVAADSCVVATEKIGGAAVRAGDGRCWAVKAPPAPAAILARVVSVVTPLAALTIRRAGANGIGTRSWGVQANGAG